MIETTESIIQTDALEPTLYDVMDQIITLHDRVDGVEDRIDNMREHIDEKFAEFLPLKPIVLGLQTMMFTMQETLILQGKLLTKLVTGMRVSEHS
ncbi:MAG: hypothetical protein JWM39_202 [Parcubacteria group bacterium]|nr:hypothetical protein [Parcubacteria group bacterium]